MRATYYVVHDPLQALSKDVLRVYELGFGKRYRLREDYTLPDVGLQLTLWDGSFENKSAIWLRWCDEQGNLIPTGAERPERETEARQKVEARLRQETKARRKAELERLRNELSTRTDLSSSIDCSKLLKLKAWFFQIG